LANTRSISRLLSLMLRHRPSEFGLTMDEFGFAPLEQVAEAVHERNEEAALEDILALAKEPGQHRFELTDRGIRALYGHTFLVEMDGEPMDPPEILYMGTTAADARRFAKDGIGPGDRFYVHLSRTRDVAASRSREARGPVVIEVLAREAAAAGVQFHSRGEVVLTREVGAQFVGQAHGLASPAQSPATGWKPAPGAVPAFGRKPRQATR
jgi:putative RNA 2'-phosphotransferase